MKYTYIFVFFIAIFSCKKEEVQPQELTYESTTEVEGDERFEDVFSTYHALKSIKITSHSSCSRSYIHQNFAYKMTPSIASGAKYFYKIHKKSEYDYVEGSHEINWTETDGFYRYDFGNKMAYHYADTSDISPLVLMDFNLSAGDSIILSESFFFGNIYFKIDEKETHTIDGQNYPAFRGHLVTNSSFYHDNSALLIAPYYPNPILIDHDFDFYLNHDWNEDNFGNSLYAFGPTHADGFVYSLKNTITDSIVTSYSIFQD